MTDKAEIIRTLETFLEPGQMTEVRAIYSKTEIYAGWYLREEAEMAAGHVEKLKACPGIYFIPNPLKHGTGKSSRGKMQKASKTTADDDITERHWLLVDFDPKRPAGISSTDGEKEWAHTTCLQVKEQMVERGFSEYVLADSGNGYHLNFKVDCPNDKQSRDDAQQLLHWLKGAFENEHVKIDTSVFNAARIWKLYGTMARKGEHTTERPHRLSRMLEIAL